MTIVENGPVLIEGPVEVTLPDGTTVSSDRFVVALCACGRSAIYPWCDTSHRRRSKGEAEGPAPGSGERRADEGESEGQRPSQ